MPTLVLLLLLLFVFATVAIAHDSLRMSLHPWKKPEQGFSLKP